MSEWREELAEHLRLAGYLCEGQAHNQLARATAALLVRYDEAEARAYRYEAEFSACKALLIAAEARAEEAEGKCRSMQDGAAELLDELAEARAEGARLEEALRAFVTKWGPRYEATEAARLAAEQRAPEARALALTNALDLLLSGKWAQMERDGEVYVCRSQVADSLRALAALPVEPARRHEQKEIQRDGDTPSAPGPAGLRSLCRTRDCACGKPDEPWVVHDADMCWRPCRGECGGEVSVYDGLCHQTHPMTDGSVVAVAELARCSDQPAPKNPPPSPTGDAE